MMALVKQGISLIKIDKRIKSDPLLRDNLDMLNYPTPFFVFDLNRLRQNYRHFKKILPSVDIHYAVKCNPHLNILSTLGQSGSRFEIASYEELKLLKKISVDPKDVLYSCPVKPPIDIKRCHKAGVYRFVFDSFLELEKIAELAPGSSVYLRLIVSDVGSKWPLSRKFGASSHEALHLMQYALELGLKPIGLTFHVGSQSTMVEAWDIALQLCGNVMKELLANGIKLEMLNMGGGFPVKYTEPIPTMDEIGQTIKRSVKQHLPYKVNLMIEPGRAIVGDTAVLVSSVIGRAQRSGKNWLYLDVGAFNGLMETTSCQGSLEYPLDSSKDQNNGREKIDFTITGPTCDSLDTMFENVKLVNNMDLGDHIYIRSAGAYTLSYASSFNGFGPPKTYFVG